MSEPATEPLDLAKEVAASLRSPFVPVFIRELAGAGRFLDVVWPQLAPSVETAGFLGSALYMADMALDAVEDVYSPLLSRETLLGGALRDDELQSLVAALDVFHWVQPQLLLLAGALAEAWDTPTVGGQGRAAPRAPSPREATHLDTAVDFARADGGLMPEVSESLQLSAAPDLYRAVAVWPSYLEVAWEELQHLATYPLFRQRARALYYYARSSSRFLAQPLHANRDVLAEQGMTDEDLTAARDAIDRALPTLATMMMHCCAMRLGLGIREREVVTEPDGRS